MDPFSDKVDEEDLDNDEDNVNERSFSSRHSNGNDDDNNFNRASLQSAIDNFKRVNSNVIH